MCFVIELEKKFITRKSMFADYSLTENPHLAYTWDEKRDALYVATQLISIAPHKYAGVQVVEKEEECR